LNKLSRTANKAWSSGLSFGEGIATPQREKNNLLRNVTQGLGFGPMAGCCEHGNEPSVAVKVGEFLNCLSDYCLLKKDSAVRLVGRSVGRSVSLLARGTLYR
jgi:hypothetical protein